MWNITKSFQIVTQKIIKLVLSPFGKHKILELLAIEYFIDIKILEKNQTKNNLNYFL